jgi:hypothetical protein
MMTGGSLFRNRSSVEQERDDVQEFGEYNSQERSNASNNSSYYPDDNLCRVNVVADSVKFRALVSRLVFERVDGFGKGSNGPVRLADHFENVAKVSGRVDWRRRLWKSTWGRASGCGVSRS